MAHRVYDQYNQQSQNKNNQQSQYHQQYQHRNNINNQQYQHHNNNYQYDQQYQHYNNNQQYYSQPKLNEKENKDIDEDINDGYKPIKQMDKLLSGGSKRSKQNENIRIKSTKIEIMDKLSQVTRNEETDKIQKCIGQICISYDGDDNEYRYGTGTTYKHLNGKYYLVITCAHNLVHFDDIKNKKQTAKKLFYLPNGVQDQKNRLKCIDWMAHEQYNARMDHCPYDIGMILCHDPKKYYQKQKLNINEFIRIDKTNKNHLKRCYIYGYPVKCEGLLMGKRGMLNKEQDEWKYRINTYGGQSGSALYKVKELDDDNDMFTIYGIHTFGNIKQNINRGVYLDQTRIEWIKNIENVMLDKMYKHKETKNKNNKVIQDNEVMIFLKAI
eukprot:493788_1